MLSRAIITYLAGKYGNNSSGGGALYPSDLRTRALVDRMFYFDAIDLLPALDRAYVSRYFKLLIRYFSFEHVLVGFYNL